MDLSTYLGNAWINTIRGGGNGTNYTAPAALYLSAHTADPGLTGTSEVGTHGSNGYNRQALTLNAASNKATANSAQIQITMPSNLGANTPVPYLGVWDSTGASNFLFKVPIGVIGNLEATVTASSDLFLTGEVHGLAANDPVEFETVGGSAMTGVSAGTIYYVKATGLTTTAFAVSAAAGDGAAINVTADTGVIVRKLTVQTYNPSNILQVGAGALTFNV